MTAVTAAAIEHELAGIRYRARIKGVSTGHPRPACSDAAVYAAPVSGGRIHRFNLNLRVSLSTATGPVPDFSPLLAVRLLVYPVHSAPASTRVLHRPARKF